MVNIQDLIERKKEQIEHNLNCLKQDMSVFAQTSPARDRLRKLLYDARTRKDAVLREELGALMTVDESLKAIMQITEKMTTNHDGTVFNRIWNEANKPYATSKSE